MLEIGCHMSTSKGFDKTVQDAVSIDANTFQFFPRSPRGTKARVISVDERDRFLEAMTKNHFIKPVMHGAYTMNLSSDKEELRKLAIRLISEDLEKLNFLGLDRYVFHPGSHVKQGPDKGCDQIVYGLNKVIQAINPNHHPMISLEGMSGKGTEIGRDFKELKYIIDRIEYDRVGVCLDTCHLYSAGFDIRNDLDGFLSEFDEKIGLEKVYIIHLNDSKTPFASNKDRHEELGKGSIGFNAIYAFCHHRAFKEIPKILETPHDKLIEYGEEIRQLRGFYEKSPQ